MANHISSEPKNGDVIVAHGAGGAAGGDGVEKNDVCLFLVNVFVFPSL